jgi:hypothetical protein
MAKIYQKTVPANEKVLINAVREAYKQPFVASNWMDLRVGFLVSICSSGGDDTITGLAEVITGPAPIQLPDTDRTSIGLTDTETGNLFIGYTNRNPLQGRGGSSNLISSDEAIGTTNANFWRVTTNPSGLPVLNPSIAIFESEQIRAASPQGSEFHLVQSTAGAGGYATLIALRLQRDRGNSKTIRVSVKKTNVHNGDISYTNTPDQATLLAALESFPAVVNTLGPISLARVPDAIWCYWPFHNSRLRIHCYGILRVG